MAEIENHFPDNSLFLLIFINEEIPSKMLKIMQEMIMNCIKLEKVWLSEELTGEFPANKTKNKKTTTGINERTKLVTANLFIIKQ